MISCNVHPARQGIFESLFAGAAVVLLVSIQTAWYVIPASRSKCQRSIYLCLDIWRQLSVGVEHAGPVIGIN